MEGEGDSSAPVHSKQYAALRSDLTAALSAFDRAQDWAVSAARLLSRSWIQSL